MKLLSALILSSVLFAAPAPADDWVGPKQPCQVDIKYYFQFDDQREVARMLRGACARCLMDVPWPSRPDSTLLLGCGPVIPDKNDHELVSRAKQLVKHRHSDDGLVFAMKMSRNPTLEEMVRFMEMGVRFYREIEHYAYVARASAGTVIELEGMEPIDWMGALKPEQKYKANYAFESNTPLEVVSIPRTGAPQCRADIEGLGGAVLYDPVDWFSGYAVKIDASKVKDVAALWWVLWIRQTPAGGAGPEGVEILDKRFE